MILTYFKTVNYPLSEATRIQFFNMDTSKLRIAFTSTYKPYAYFNNCLILSVYLFPLIFPILFVFSLISKISIYGPSDSRLLKFMHSVSISERLYTDAADYKLRNINYEPLPVMDIALTQEVKCDHSSEAVRILYMSHASEFKGLYDLVRILKTLKNHNIHLRLCFSKSVDQNLVYFLERELSHIQKLEILGVVDYIEQLKWADIYYYVYWFERWTYIVPLSLLEAVMLNCIPIGPDFISVRRWINTDFLVEPTDLDNCAKKLDSIISNNDHYARLARNNRSFLLENCNWRRTERT